MCNRELFNQKEFPEWKGYNITSESINHIKELWFDNTTLMAKTIYELSLENRYFKDMLLYIQRKMCLDEPLELCLNSAKEVFDVMITPCEILNDEGKELTLDDYEELRDKEV